MRQDARGGMRHRIRQWYVIHTKPRQETRAADNLQRQNLEIYLPRLEQVRRYRGQWRRSIEPLLPRYPFIRLALGRDNTAPIRSTRGITRLVSLNGRPAAVPESFIEALTGCADTDTGVHHPRPSLFEPCRAVTIANGPLQGLEAIFQAQDGEARAMILLGLLGKIQKPRIAKDHLWPARIA